MPIHFSCPLCHANLTAKDKQSGRTLTCPACRERITIPIDYYKILRVASDASAAEIDAAYRALAMEYHPDHHPDDSKAIEKFKLCGMAYEILSDPVKRAEYDRTHPRNVVGDTEEASNTNTPPTQSSFKNIYDVARKGTVADIKFFVEQKGIDIYIKDSDGGTLLHYAAALNSNVEVLEYIIDQGVFINAKQDDGFTPLQAAALYNPNEAILQFLISRGADVNDRCDTSRTPLDFANTEAKRRVLREAGGFSGLAAAGSKFLAKGNIKGAKICFGQAAKDGDDESITIMIGLDKHNIEWLQMARERGEAAIKIMLASEYCEAVHSNKANFESNFQHLHEHILTLFKNCEEARECVEQWIADLEAVGKADGSAYAYAIGAYRTEFTEQGYDRCNYYLEKALADHRKTKKNDDPLIIAIERAKAVINEDYRNGKYTEEMTAAIVNSEEVAVKSKMMRDLWIVIVSIIIGIVFFAVGPGGPSGITIIICGTILGLGFISYVAVFRTFIIPIYENGYKIVNFFLENPDTSRGVMFMATFFVLPWLLMGTALTAPVFTIIRFIKHFQQWRRH